MPRQMLRVGGLLSLLALSGATGCDSKDAEKCEEALKVSRQSVALDDFALAQQWRERAWKNCADTNSLDALDKEIVAKKTAVEAKKQEETQRKTQNEALLKLFVDWASANRGSPDRASAAPKCDEPPAGAPPPKPADKERFCTGTRSAAEYTLTARYWDADKTAFRFTTRPKAPVTCDDLGANRVLKTWAVPAIDGRTVTRTRCELTGGGLSGLQAVVSAANNAEVYVFSLPYLQKDPAMAKIAGGP